MYSRITDSSFDIFDGETGNYMGHSHFTLPQGSEIKLLNLLNYNKVPDTLVLLNVAFSEISANFVPPELFQKQSRTSTLYIDAVDAYSEKLVPIEIVMRYDVIVRGHLSENPYFFESLQLENIKIQSIDYRYV